jgi:hypothetical protein
MRALKSFFSPLMESLQPFGSGVVLQRIREIASTPLRSSLAASMSLFDNCLQLVTARLQERSQSSDEGSESEILSTLRPIKSKRKSKTSSSASLQVTAWAEAGSPNEIPNSRNAVIVDAKRNFRVI